MNKRPQYTKGFTTVTAGEPLMLLVACVALGLCALWKLSAEKPRTSPPMPTRPCIEYETADVWIGEEWVKVEYAD